MPERVFIFDENINRNDIEYKQAQVKRRRKKKIKHKQRGKSKEIDSRRLSATQFNSFFRATTKQNFTIMVAASNAVG